MGYFKVKKGFTLVEIMVVTAIIVLLAVVAIPGLLRARHNANEATAIGALKLIRDAMANYHGMQSPPSYPAALVNLSDAVPPYLDSVLTSGTKQGYVYTYTSGVNTYSVVASPSTSNVTGTRVFFVNESGIIRLDDAAGDPL